MWGKTNVRRALGAAAFCVFAIGTAGCDDNKDDDKTPTGGCDVVAESCDENATCVEAGEGEDSASCVCNDGFTGDGEICSPESGEDAQPVGSACTSSDECAGPGTPECIIKELAPLSAFESSDDEFAQMLAELARVPLPGNYCSTVAPCANDDECGTGGTCFLPLIDVAEEDYADLLEMFEGDDREAFAAFRTYGMCLDACDPADENACTRPGYHCEVPLVDLVGLAESIGARMETYCIGDPTCDACDENATCDDDVDEGEPVICTCNEGFEGDGYSCTSDSEVDECSKDEDCQGDDTCANGACVPPASGATGCDANNPCADTGTCVDLDGGAVLCECDFGYDGPTCADAVDACETNPCLNDGACSMTGAGTFSCECDTNWGGEICNEPVYGCEDNPCKNGASCIDGDDVGEYACNCTFGYEGDTCGTAIDLCEKNDHDCEQGECRFDGPGTYTCDCDEGYEGDYCETESNACANANPCGDNGVCIDQGAGDYTCDCNKGFEGDHCETEAFCILNYDIQADVRFRDTNPSSGEREQPADSDSHGDHPEYPTPGTMNGKLTIRLEVENGQLTEDAKAEILYYELHQHYWNGSKGASYGADIWNFSPARDAIDNTEAIATGIVAAAGGSTTLSFPDCTLPEGWDNDRDSYTPDVNATGAGCLANHRHEGELFCNDTNLKCKKYKLNRHEPTFQDYTWNQVLPDIVLDAGFATLGFDPGYINPNNGQEDGRGEQPPRIGEQGWMEFPTEAEARTYMRWTGTLNAAESTCQNL